MEWAYELLRGYRAGNRRAVRLVNTTRTIIVPIVNPDGFNLSREAGQLQGGGNGRDADSYEETLTQLVAFGQEYWRKNCRFPTDANDGSCMQPGNGVEHPGVDPNRNYGGFWVWPGRERHPGRGGLPRPRPVLGAGDPEHPGPDLAPSGHRPDHEPRSRTWCSGRRARPVSPTRPTSRSTGSSAGRWRPRTGTRASRRSSSTTPRAASRTGATSPRAGSPTRSRSGCGARIEGTNECDYGNFHGPFREVAAEYRGTSRFAGPGGGNRAAYFVAQESAANPNRHSIIQGRPRATPSCLQKTFQTETWKGEQGSFRDHLETDRRTEVGPVPVASTPRPGRWRHGSEGAPRRATRARRSSSPGALPDPRLTARSPAATSRPPTRPAGTTTRSRFRGGRASTTPGRPSRSTGSRLSATGT